MQVFPTSPTDLEQQLLPQLEQQYEAGRARLQAMLPQSGVATLAQVSAAIACANDLERTLHAYEPAALYLNAQNFPRLLARIEEVRRDTQGAKTTFMAMYPSAFPQPPTMSSVPAPGAPAAGTDADRASASCVAMVAAEQQAVDARLYAFALSSGSASPGQLQGYINELNGFLGRLWVLRPTVNGLLAQGQPDCSQQLEALIQHVQENIRLYQSVQLSRISYLQAMGWQVFP